MSRDNYFRSMEQVVRGAVYTTLLFAAAHEAERPQDMQSLADSNWKRQTADDLIAVAVEKCRALAAGRDLLVSEDDIVDAIKLAKAGECSCHYAPCLHDKIREAIGP